MSPEKASLVAKATLVPNGQFDKLNFYGFSLLNHKYLVCLGFEILAKVRKEKNVCVVVVVVALSW